MRFAKLVVLPKNERDLMKRDQVDGECTHNKIYTAICSYFKIVHDL